MMATHGGPQQAAKVRASKIGIGVSKEGQQLFDALAKTMDCRWSGTTIVCRIADSEASLVLARHHGRVDILIYKAALS